MKEKLTACEFSWDEPEGCSSPRGWCHLDNHPQEDSHDDYSGCRCVGNYLDYGPQPGDSEEDRYRSSKGPNGEFIHAVAYIFDHNKLTGMRHTINLGYAWFNTIEEAKVFIESNLCAFFGIERKPMHHFRVTA